MKTQNKKSAHGIMGNGDDFKNCPYCGQSKIPFKLGVCICGKQVGAIQYVESPSRFAKNHYSHIENAGISTINELA
ncbi:MAG: hypothetical protein OEW78_06650 [Nitrosopumilus sp.]|uniref:hypothetical protein n=1 Tax=Nitrosopumilus sp. TaxID=2024843 RepID=UPI00246F24ED|nr:hypothetical protein [Nitrosopumilus sp.]MDH5431544.1 hypothetical protein [Nitrosopumilus sp.]